MLQLLELAALGLPPFVYNMWPAWASDGDQISDISWPSSHLEDILHREISCCVITHCQYLKLSHEHWATRKWGCNSHCQCLSPLIPNLQIVLYFPSKDEWQPVLPVHDTDVPHHLQLCCFCKLCYMAICFSMRVYFKLHVLPNAQLSIRISI